MTLDVFGVGMSLDLIEKMTGRSTYELAYGDYPDKRTYNRPILERLGIGDRG